MVDLHPTKCNICGGTVLYTSNARIYGRTYGSGFCYLCEACGAYVGTHRPRPREALGLLADERMRYLKKACHALFDPLWQHKPQATQRRKDMYHWLAQQMGIPDEDCHFGYFGVEELEKAQKILIQVNGRPLDYIQKSEVK